MNNLLPQTTLRDLALIVFKRKWSILLIFFSALLCSLAYVMLIRDDVYEVTAKFLVKLGPEQTPPATIMGFPPMALGYRHHEVNSEIEIFQSAQLIGRVVDKFKLDQPAPPTVPPPGLLARVRYEMKRVNAQVRDWVDETLIRAGLRVRLSPRESIVYLLQHGLFVQPQRESNVFIAKMLSGNREHGAPILNAIVEEYLQFRQTLYEDGTALPFFNSEIASRSKELNTAETDLKAFENAGGISAIEKQKEVLLGQIATARSTASEARIRLDDLQVKAAKLAEEMAKDEPDFASLGAFDKDQFLQGLLSQLAELQRERARLRLAELDGGSRIQNNRMQFRTVLNVLSGNLKSVLAQKDSEHTARVTEFRGLEQKLALLNDQELRWMGLKRQANTLADSYSLYRKKFDESSANVRLHQRYTGNVVVLESPTPPLQPVGSRKITLIGLGMLMSVVLSIVWLAVAEFFDHDVHSAEALEQRLGARVLAVVPVKKGKRPWRFDGDGGEELMRARAAGA